MDFANDEPFRSQPSPVYRFWKIFSQRYQSLLDAWTPYILGRWVFSCVLLLTFMGRVIVCEGWYIVAYALGIYYLNLLIAFLTPKIDPAFEQFEDENDDGPSLPTANDEEFRPFIRRLAEFKFWHSASKATFVALFCSFFEVFNIPVFWPILLLYFVTLFMITMKRQIRHMIKYNYLPWTTGKAKYRGKEDSSKVYSNNESMVPLMTEEEPTTSAVTEM